MSDVSEYIWHRFRGSLPGRLIAGALIAAPFGALAAAEILPTPAAIILSALAAALTGVLAVGLLELRDRRRRQSVEWQQRVARTSGELREHHPEIPDKHALQVATAVEESRFTPLAWVGMVLGGLCVACSVAMLIARIIQSF